MNKRPIKIAITGAAGNIGYAALFRIAAGDIFGKDQPVILHLIEIEPAMKALEGTVMELNDAAFPLLQGIETSSNLDKGFNGVNWALLIGSVPRKQGMERADLLGINGKIFIAQGKAIEKNAASDIRTLVVGNPCNTNCLIAMNNAKDIPSDRWFAMTRLDENRAKSQIAEKAGVHSSEITRLVIWGNHSATQYPDFTNGLINNKKITEVITDNDWLDGEFITTVQQRGAQIIKARGASSAASAASAALDTVRSLSNSTPEGDITSVAICSNGEYGIEKGLIASMPVITNQDNTWKVDESFEISNYSQEKIDITINELKEEREAVKDLI